MAAHEKVPPHRRRAYPIANADRPVINSAGAIRGFEATAKTLNTPIVLSDDFARDYGEPFISLGHRTQPPTFEHSKSDQLMAQCV